MICVVFCDVELGFQNVFFVGAAFATQSAHFQCIRSTNSLHFILLCREKTTNVQQCFEMSSAGYGINLRWNERLKGNAASTRCRQVQKWVNGKIIKWNRFRIWLGIIDLVSFQYLWFRINWNYSPNNFGCNVVQIIRKKMSVTSSALREQLNNAAALLQDLAATSYLTHVSQTYSKTAHRHLAWIRL